MKHCLAFLIVLASYSLAQAQHEIRCKLVDSFASDWNNNTVSVGSCSTNPQLWKRVTYQSSVPWGSRTGLVEYLRYLPTSGISKFLHDYGAKCVLDWCLLCARWLCARRMLAYFFSHRVGTTSLSTAETFSFKPPNLSVS
jgi:hypothetical protein